MRRTLVWKLTIAFLLVAVTVSLLVGVSLRLVNPAQFNSLIVTQQRSDFRTQLTTYYADHNSWQGVYEYMLAQAGFTAPLSATSAADPRTGFPANGPNPNGPNPRDWRNHFGLADSQGNVLIPMMPELPLGEKASAGQLAAGDPITVDGATVGIILTAPRPPNLSPEESAYVERTNIALLLAGASAFLVALLMGVLLARTLTRPLRALTQATQRMAGGDLEQEVPQGSRDEIGELAAAFNQMSRAVAQANRARRQMAVDVAHELRTPLTVVSGYIESMRDGVLAPTPERLAVMYAEIEHLQRLVDDLRILNQTDAGELTLHSQAVAPVDIMRQASAAFEHQAGQQRVTLDLDVDDSVLPVRMDETRMTQVITNLLSNALRHTPAGGRITLGVRGEPDAVVLTVADTGSGISAENLPHIFDRFFRADDGGTSGLGLAIARGLVTAQGGAIEAESVEGEGTTMRVRLPREKSS